MVHSQKLMCQTSTMCIASGICQWGRWQCTRCCCNGHLSQLIERTLGSETRCNEWLCSTVEISCILVTPFWQRSRSGSFLIIVLILNCCHLNSSQYFLSWKATGKVCLEGNKLSIPDTCSDFLKPLKHLMCVVDLKQYSCCHLMHIQEMMYVSSCMMPACEAGAIYHQRLCVCPILDIHDVDLHSVCRTCITSAILSGCKVHCTTSAGHLHHKQ